MKKNPILTISEIQITPINPRNGLVGFACFTLNGVRFNNIGIYSDIRNSGFRLTYPLKELPTGKKVYLFYPINKETGQFITKAVTRKFEEIINKNVKKEDVKNGKETNITTTRSYI